MKKFYVNILVLSALFAVEVHGQEAVILKVARIYGIINKGANQGVSEGLIYYVKRGSDSGLIDVGKVKVIRVTANRAAVEQISTSTDPFLKIGDKLFADNRKSEVFRSKRTVNKNKAAPSSSRQKKKSINNRSKIKRSTKEKDIPLTKTRDYPFQKNGLKTPWVSLNLGAGVPTGDLVTAYSASFRIGGSYMVSAARNFYLGLEINNTWFNNSSSLVDANSIGFGKTSASILEALLTVQRFIGDNFFIELGGGMYRPKVRTISLDGNESTYSSANFGLFGGSGFFIPMSEHSGFTLKGRFHNYFDRQTKRYFGITGGFRFKIR